MNLNQEAYDDLEDFDSEDLEQVEDADDDYLQGMWGGRSFRGSDNIVQDTIIAHGMVQSFVNAFARDGHYVVSFDASVSTAGTDMAAKSVVITPAPIADPALDAQQAGLILTGLAVHEISHPRYGRRTAQAVQAVFPGNGVADRLSNLLDDIRIERRFVADYPGYAGVFTPTLDYIGKAGTKNGLHVQRVSDQVNLAIAATRYPTFSKWNAATEIEAAWWTDWADRGSKEDSPKRHVDFIREALQHVAAAKIANPKKGPEGKREDAPQAPRSEKSDEAPQATQSNGDETPDETPVTSGGEASQAAQAMDDKDLNEATADADEDETEKASSCSGSGSVDQAVNENGVSRRDINELKQEAQEIVESSRNIEDDGHGNPVDVAKSLKGLTHGGRRLGASDIASRYIRNAILRSRTGNTAVDPFKRRGRLDQKGLERIAFGDTRVFEKRTAPSPGKFLIWVMVDASGSMDNELPAAAQVAHAMATATHGTPSVRMAVYAWSSPFRRSTAFAGVAKVWESGQDADAIFRMSGLQTGGTPDASITSWAARAIKRAARQDETPVLIIVSDGTGDTEMTARVQEARDMGVVVKSVSFGHYFTAADQLARFGKGNFIPFAGTIVATAKPLAELFGRMVGGR